MKENGMITKSMEGVKKYKKKIHNMKGNLRMLNTKGKDR